MTINILTLFPNFFDSCLNESILKRAQEKGLIKIRLVNIRDFANDKYQTTDDRPFGGGPGMVMKVEPIDRALKWIKKESKSNLNVQLKKNSKTILTSAKGQLFTQEIAKKYAHLTELTIICGHYEGVDERVAQHLVDEEIRIGDFVLTGGEAACLVMIDTIGRLIPGVLGNEKSNLNESHSQLGKLTYPQYTRPEKYQNWAVPKILLSGHHQEIETWREKKTKQTR